jgi:hypothetical protein
MIVVSEINLHDPFSVPTITVPICHYCGGYLQFDEDRNVICDCPLSQLDIQIQNDMRRVEGVDL